MSNGDEIEAIVTKVETAEIEYKKWSNQDGPTYIENTDNIFFIKYQNGEKDIFSKQNSNNKEVPTLKSNANLTNDLLIYSDYDEVFYKGKKLDNYELTTLLQKNCEEAYDQYCSGKKKRSVAIALKTVGFICLGISIPFYMSSEQNSNIAASIMDIAGTALLITSFPLGSGGKNQMKDSFETYNNKIKQNSRDVSLNIGTCHDGGFGISLRF